MVLSIRGVTTGYGKVKILRGIENYKRRAGRFLLNFVDRMATELTAYLSDVEGVEKVTPAGSLRRGKETIGDLDLLVTGPNASVALDHFVKFDGVNAREGIVYGFQIGEHGPWSPLFCPKPDNNPTTITVHSPPVTGFFVGDAAGSVSRT